MIKQIDCNLLDAPVDAIAHCCNCFNTMGSGVALAIRNKYPEVYRADCKTIKGDTNKLGYYSYAVVEIPDNQINACFNLYGQYDYGRNGRKVNYEAIYKSLCNMRDYMPKYNLKSIGIPYKMCCNLAGGDWRIIEAMIKVVFEDSNIDVLICNYQG